MKIPKMLRAMLPEDLRYYSQGAFWLGLGQIASSVLTFVLAIAMTNLISKELYGSYEYVLSVITLCGLAAITETATALTRAIARGFEGSVRDAVRFKVSWGLLGSVLSLGIAAYHFAHGSTELASAFCVAAVFIPLNDPAGLYDSVLNGKKMFQRSAIYGVCVQIVGTLAIIAAVYFAPQLGVMVFATFAAVVCIRIGFFWWTMRSIPLNDRHDPELKPLALHLSLMKGLNVASGTVYSVYLYHHLGGAGLAIYTVAIAPVEQVRGLLTSIENILLPKAALPNWSTDTRLFARKLLPAIGLIILGVLGYVVLIPWFFRLFFPRYVEAIIYSQWYSVSLVLTFISIVIVSVFRGRGWIRPLHIMNGIDISLYLGLSIPLIYLFGIAGLIGSILFIKCVDVGVLTYFFFRSNRLSKKDHLSKAGANGMKVNE